MDDKDKKDLIKFNIVREDALNNSRLSWLLTFQGLLFTAYAVLATSNSVENLVVFKKSLPILGIITAIPALIVLSMGTNSIRLLHGMWIKIAPDEKLTPLGLQKIGKGYAFSIFGLGSVLPFSCIIAWLFILCCI